MPDFSLLYPKGVKPSGKTLSEDAVNDLSVEHICEKLTGEVFEQNIIKNIMITIESDPKVISYRRDVFDDLYHFPDLRERIKELLEELAFLKDLERAAKDTTAAPIWQLVNRLHELDIYVTCISEIHHALQNHDIHSEGLLELRDFVGSVFNENGFEYLHSDIKELVGEVSQIKSLALGVNLDNKLMPCEVGILSINDRHFTRPGLLNKFLDFSSVKQNGIHSGTNINGMTKIHTVGKVTGEDPLMNNLSRVVADMLGTTVKQLKSKLAKYTNVSGYGLIKMIPEFIFYIRWADFMSRLMETNVPLCKPEIISDGSRDTYVKGLYNFKLAIRRMNAQKNEEIILNDFEFTGEHGIYIMTGPNRGGKTTFTQAVGLLFLMAQCGVYVPAESARLAPVDCIYTHFPADENKTVDLGRLGEESQRMSEIFSVATNRSLLLFNESLATTSFAEGLYIAKDVVRALRYLGARTIFNTHMHELAMFCNDVNRQIKGDLDIASLITGIHEGKRSYKIFLAPPEGVSYAQDIAKKYGVTFDQLSERINTEKE